MASNKTETPYQLVALPIPEYLIDYLCGKLNVRPIVLDNGSRATELPITRRTFFGEFIADNLKLSKSINKHQSNFYVKISDNISRRKKGIPDTRYNIVKINPTKYLVLEKILRNNLETDLVSFVKGSVYAYHEVKGKRKGMVHKSIYEFMQINGIPFSNSTFETLKKIYFRGKNIPKPLKTLTV